MSSVDETSIKFTWNASKACDGIQYSLNGGNWVGGDWPQTNITGLSANTQYSVKIRVKATDSQLWTESGVKYATTYAYPYCTSAPSFKIGNNVKLDFYNPLNRTIKIQMWSYNSQGFVSDQITTTGTTYTGFSNVKDRLYASIPDKTESQYTIDVWYGDIKSTKWDCGKYSINGNEKPTFSNFTYADTNSKTVGLTGNNQILVNGYSNLKVTVSTANKAYSNYGSPIKKYRLNVGNMSSVEKDYTASEAVEMSINAVNSPSITVTAIDSREYTTPISKTSSFKAYKKPVIKSMNVYRSDGGVGSQVTLEFDGEWWNDNFGSVANTINNIVYYYKKTTESSWTKGNIVIIPTISGDNFSGSILIEGPNASDKGFDISTAYNIKMSVTDALTTSTEYQITLGTGAPAIAICENKVAIGAKYDEELGGTLQVQGTKFSRRQLKLPNFSSAGYVKLGKVVLWEQCDSLIINIYAGNGQNSMASQNSIMRIFTKRGWSGDAEYSGTTVEFLENCHTGIRVYVIHEDRATANIYIYFPYPYFGGFYTIEGTYGEYKHICEYSTTAPEGQSQDVGYKTVEYNNYTNYEEQIGTWIDGKPLYRKILIITDLQQSDSWKNYAFSSLGLSDIEYIHEKFNSLRAKGMYSTTTETIASFGGRLQFDINYQRLSTFFTYGSDITLEELIIAVEYTKTTD